jgi:hypothetical protein
MLVPPLQSRTQKLEAHIMHLYTWAEGKLHCARCQGRIYCRCKWRGECERLKWSAFETHLQLSCIALIIQWLFWLENSMSIRNVFVVVVLQSNWRYFLSAWGKNSESENYLVRLIRFIFHNNLEDFNAHTRISLLSICKALAWNFDSCLFTVKHWFCFSLDVEWILWDIGQCWCTLWQ